MIGSRTNQRTMKETGLSRNPSRMASPDRLAPRMSSQMTTRNPAQETRHATGVEIG